MEAVETRLGRVTLRTHDPNRTVRALLEVAPAVKDLEVSATELEEAFVELTKEDGS